MAKNKNNTEIEYADREISDSELINAVSEIKSAEEQAKAILAQAEASVKAVQLDRATRERDMRKVSAATMAAARDEAMRDATLRAEKDRARKIEQAEKAGEELIKSKRKAIDARVAELYAKLKGNKK